MFRKKDFGNTIQTAPASLRRCSATFVAEDTVVPDETCLFPGSLILRASTYATFLVTKVQSP